MTLAIVLPTRGMVFTEVENIIDSIQATTKATVLRSFNKPIPDAQNYLVEQALLLPDVTHILFMEEDTIPPYQVAMDLLGSNVDIAFVDYAVNGWSCSARTKQGEILWCGFGCTLVKREVFEKLEEPYFRTDKSLRLNDWQWTDNPMKYGGQDIWFCTKAKEAEFTIKQIPGECRHLSLEMVGKKEDNNGRHLIVERERISKTQIIDRTEVDK